MQSIVRSIGTSRLLLGFSCLSFLPGTTAAAIARAACRASGASRAGPWRSPTGRRSAAAAPSAACFTAEGPFRALDTRRIRGRLINSGCSAALVLLLRRRAAALGSFGHFQIFGLSGASLKSCLEFLAGLLPILKVGQGGGRKKYAVMTHVVNSCEPMSGTRCPGCADESLRIYLLPFVVTHGCGRDTPSLELYYVKSDALRSPHFTQRRRLYPARPSTSWTHACFMSHAPQATSQLLGVVPDDDDVRLFRDVRRWW